MVEKQGVRAVKLADTRDIFDRLPKTVANVGVKDCVCFGSVPRKKAFNDTGPSKRMPPMLPKGFSLRFDELLTTSWHVGRPHD